MDKKDINITDIIKDLEKEYGKKTFLKLDAKNINNVETISSGSLNIDEALGIGGYPKGRIIEIFGTESSGKTTLALQAIAECQKKGGVAVFIDAEHALDINFAQKIGVDLKKLIITQPDSGEEALELVDFLCNKGQIDLVVVDSVAALVPKVELEGKMEDQNIGLQARMMSKGLRLISASASKSNTTVIFINQIREKVGVIFGNPETTSGGRALRFYSSIRLEVKLKERLKESDKQYAQKIRVRVIKNKMAPPYRIVETVIDYEKGIDNIWEIVYLSKEKGIIELKGSWVYFKNEKICQGTEKLKEKLETDMKLRKEILNNL